MSTSSYTRSAATLAIILGAREEDVLTVDSTDRPVASLDEIARTHYVMVAPSEPPPVAILRTPPGPPRQGRRNKPKKDWQR